MLYETMWLKDARVVASKRFPSQAEAERDAHQLFPFYQKHFGATRVEVWNGSQRLFLIEANEEKLPPVT